MATISAEQVSEMSSFDEQIQHINRQINQVEEKISEVEQSLKENKDTAGLSEEEKQERKEERKWLRTEKEQLRMEKEQLRTEKEQLRTKEAQLRDLQLKLPALPRKKSKTSVDFMHEDIGAPSSFGKNKNWNEVQTRLDDKAIKCHRPPQYYGTHVSLHYKGFDTFSSECSAVTIDRNDCTFVLDFCWQMAAAYSHEAKRRAVVNKCLSSYFQLGDHRIEEISNMDGAIKIAEFPILIIEAKNEVGSGGCDSYMEAVAYYYKNAPISELEYSNAPCFIVEIVGPHFAISGAVVGQSVLVDRLTPFLWCVPQPNDRAAMTDLTKCLKALKNALHQLKQDCKKHLKQPRFPFFTNNDQITYIKEIKNNVFLCQLDNEVKQKQVIVKFVEAYGIEAHMFMAEQGYAPSVEMYLPVTSRYHAVVMEYIEGATSLLKCHAEKNRTTKEKLKKIVNQMHKGQFCHGDLRSNNILVLPTSRLVIIDFDWAGEIGKQRYPFFMNHTEIKWPTNASDNELISVDHDLYWVEENFN